MITEINYNATDMTLDYLISTLGKYSDAIKINEVAGSWRGGAYIHQLRLKGYIILSQTLPNGCAMYQLISKYPTKSHSLKAIKKQKIIDIINKYKNSNYLTPEKCYDELWGTFISKDFEPPQWPQWVYSKREIIAKRLENTGRQIEYIDYDIKLNKFFIKLKAIKKIFEI